MSIQAQKEILSGCVTQLEWKQVSTIVNQTADGYLFLFKIQGGMSEKVLKNMAWTIKWQLQCDRDLQAKRAGRGRSIEGCLLAIINSRLTSELRLKVCLLCHLVHLRLVVAIASSPSFDLRVDRIDRCSYWSKLTFVTTNCLQQTGLKEHECIFYCYHVLKYQYLDSIMHMLSIRVTFFRLLSQYFNGNDQFLSHSH